MRPFGVFFLTCVYFGVTVDSIALGSPKAANLRSFFHNFQLNHPSWNPLNLFHNRDKGQNDLATAQTNANNLGAASNGHFGIGFTIDYDKHKETAASQAMSGSTQESISEPDPSNEVLDGIVTPSKIKDTTTHTPVIKDDITHTPIIIIDAATLLSLNQGDSSSASNTISEPQTTSNFHQTTPYFQQTAYHSANNNLLVGGNEGFTLIPQSPSQNKDYVSPQPESETAINISGDLVSENPVFLVETKNNTTQKLVTDIETSSHKLEARPSNMIVDSTTLETFSRRNFEESTFNSVVPDVGGIPETGTSTNDGTNILTEMKPPELVTNFQSTVEGNKHLSAVTESFTSSAPSKDYSSSPSQPERADSGTSSAPSKDYSSSLGPSQPEKTDSGIRFETSQSHTVSSTQEDYPHGISSVLPITAGYHVSPAPSEPNKGYTPQTSILPIWVKNHVPTSTSPPSGLALIRAHYYPVSANFWYPHNGPYHTYTTEYLPPQPQFYQQPVYQAPVYFTDDPYSATGSYDRPTFYNKPQKPMFAPVDYGENAATLYDYKPATKPVYLTKGTTPYRGVTIYLDSEPETTTQFSTVFSANEVTTEKPSINSWFKPPQFLTNIISVLNKDNVGKPRDKPTAKPQS